MEGNGDADRDRGSGSVEHSAAEGDGDRGRYSLVRCASQSSLDECSQRRGAGEAGEAAAGAVHAASLLHSLSRLRRDDVLCDVRLVAQAPGEAAQSAESGEAVGVCAHRAVLAACSPYFRAMFTQFDERTQAVITIQDVEPSALAAIVEYVYSPESLVMTEDSVQSLLSAASLLQVRGVRAAACSFLAAALAPDNALGIRAFADLHACADLADVADRFVKRHFVEVLESEEFLALDCDVLAALLDSDRITVPNEELVLDAVIRWMQHDPENRRCRLGALLEHVRLPLLPQDVLVARAAAEPLASAELRVKDLVIEALSFHLLRPERRAAAAAASARARPRQPPRSPKVLLVVGGQAPKAIRDVEAFHMESGRWRAAAELPTRRCRAGLAAVGARLYAIGGFNGTLRVRSVDVYDVGADAWSPGPPLCARRSTLGVAVVGNVIYAVGGFDGATGLSSAEALDVREGVWRSIASMSTRRSSVGVAALDGKLYAVGGYDGASRQCLHTVERYDPAADAWEPVAEMAARRSGAGVGVAGGALYALGGHDGPAVRRSVERYRERDGWAPAPPMTHARRNAGVASHHGRLYVAGGDDGAANLATVEVFDPATEQWSMLSSAMSVARSYAGVAVVERAA
ncbi:putative kelch protein 1 [Danaus plexippus plexippus]|uniref:Kelch-like protein diablo n=1 Tax=Danaus plexippus plexippus TaxID=278856 RepID=A0A212FAW7_DANPL|nr:putative kelch protein 1 [Danaus plexippus plexippus]